MPYPAEAFEQYIVPPLFELWAEKLIQIAQPRKGERVLDVACGTGIVARRIAPLVSPSGTVAGLDFNPNMGVSRAGPQSALDSRLIFGRGRRRLSHLPIAASIWSLASSGSCCSVTN